MTNKPVEKGSTDNSVVLRALSTADGSPVTNITSATSGLELRYWKGEGGTVNIVAPASQTSTGAHTDGGIAHKHGGAYRVDVPDAAADTEGTTYVSAGGVSGVVFSVATLAVVDFNPTADNTPNIAAAVVAAEKDALDGFLATGVEVELDGQTYDVTRDPTDKFLTSMSKQP